MQNILIALAALVLIAGGGYYWYSSNNADPAPEVAVEETTESAGMPVPGTSTEEMTAVREFEVTNAGFAYSLKEIKVKRGETVKITYTNGGGTHDLRIDGYNVGTKVLGAEKSETFEFVADEAGTFEFYCSVGNHRAMGMKGTFVVEE